jgi:hypothetical protein
MKNFPEQDQFNDLEKRLHGYSEEPDEIVWQNIDKALRPGKKTFWFPWIDRLSSIVAIGLIGLLVNFDFPKALQANVATGKQDEASINDKKFYHAQPHQMFQPVRFRIK